MKSLHGSAAADVAASAEACFAVLADVERYPDWYPELVRSVSVLERHGDGRPRRGRAALHVAYGPLVKDLDLLLEIHADRPRAVVLTRVPHDPSDGEEFEVSWRLEADGGETRISLELHASLSVPRLLPLSGLGDSFAQGFVRAAAGAIQGAAPA